MKTRGPFARLYLQLFTLDKRVPIVFSLPKLLQLGSKFSGSLTTFEALLAIINLHVISKHMERRQGFQSLPTLHSEADLDNITTSSSLEWFLLFKLCHYDCIANSHTLLPSAGVQRSVCWVNMVWTLFD